MEGLPNQRPPSPTYKMLFEKILPGKQNCDWGVPIDFIKDFVKSKGFF